MIRTPDFSSATGTDLEDRPGYRDVEMQARFELAYPNFAGSAVTTPVTASCWLRTRVSNPHQPLQRRPYSLSIRKNGLGGRLRSCGPRVPNTVLYLTELHPDDDGADGRIRTRIFHPVTFVRVRSTEGYVSMLLELLAGIDPAFPP